jgi:aryl-alcohol dehydrogenase-like predicted oxidoreductase
VSGTFAIGGDLPVHRLGFGSMQLTGRGTWGEPANPREAIAVLRRAVELGVNLIDTADSYGPHVAERLIAEALRPYPADLVIATKAGLQRPGPGVGYRTEDPSTCARRVKEAFVGSTSIESISISCIASTPRFRSRT